jgi:4-hydroxy-tetrahydrodipicolinate reductase
VKKQVQIIIFGGSGRMGNEIFKAASENKHVATATRISRKNRQDLEKHISQADVIIDFSSPAGSLSCAAAAAKAHIPVVIGTTGFSPAQLKKLKAFSKKTALLFAPNCSLGMNVLFELSRKAAAALAKYDAAISESHHTKKKDSPSGSAKKIAEAVQEGRGNKKNIPTVSLRIGDVIGDHTLTLAGPDERLELTHRAQNRSVFARGAVEAALWVYKKKKGFLTMRDMLHL